MADVVAWYRAETKAARERREKRYAKRYAKPRIAVREPSTERRVVRVRRERAERRAEFDAVTNHLGLREKLTCERLLVLEGYAQLMPKLRPYVVYRPGAT